MAGISFILNWFNLGLGVNDKNNNYLGYKIDNNQNWI